MTYTVIPSIKGQVTLPPTIRKKYKISKETPLVIVDEGNGTIKIKVMRMVDQNDVVYYENENESGLFFKKGIDPQKIIDAIDKIDGPNRKVSSKTESKKQAKTTKNNKRRS